MSVSFFLRPAAVPVEILTQVECGQFFKRIEWVKKNEHARLYLKDGIPNHWFLFSLRGVKGKTLLLEVICGSTIHGSFNWEKVRPLVADTGNISDPLLYDEGGYQQKFHKLPWRRIPESKFNAKTKTMLMKPNFEANEATIALKFPCPPAYVEKRLAQLTNEVNEGVLGIYSAGLSPENRPLRVLSVPALDGPTAARWKEKPTILIYGGEHATEHESMHVVMGALEWLLSSSGFYYRSDFNVLLVPHLNPDDTVKSIFNRITDGFHGAQGGPTGPENLTWAKYWNRYFDESQIKLDIVIGLHNLSPGDSVNFFSPLEQAKTIGDFKFSHAFHEIIMDQFKDSSLVVDRKRGIDVSEGRRLFGWIPVHFGGLGSIYEVNAQLPGHELSLTRLRLIGVDLLRGAASFTQQEQLFAELREGEKARLKHRAERIAAVMSDPNVIRERLTRGEKEPPRFTFNLLF